MIFVDKKELLEALKTVGKAVKPKTTLPVLTCVKLENLENQLVVSGTDHEQFVTQIVGIRDNDELHACVLYTLFRDVIGAISGNKIGLEQDASKLYISGSDTKTELPITDSDEFPLTPQLEGLEVTLDCQLLKSLIGNTIHAVGTDTGRIVLTGMLVQAVGTELKFVAADGYCMAVTSATVGDIDDFSCIVPGEVLKNWLPILADREQDVTIHLGEQRIVLHVTGTPEVYHYSQLIQGNFVNFVQILPKDYTRRIVVDTDALLEALKVVGVLAKTGANRVQIKARDAHVTLEAKGLDFGMSTADIQALEFDGEFETSVNGKLLKDALNTCGDEVVLQDGGQHRPIEVFTAGYSGGVDESEKDNHICVIMPMHVRDN